MAHDVFISHSSKDKTIADAVCATLEKRGIRCWIAPRDVPPGQSWPAALVDGIRNSKVFVLVFSDVSNQSKQVTTEVGEAFDNSIPIVPFRIDDVKPSREMGYYIKSIHWLDAMNPPMERHLDKLAESITALLSIEKKDQLPAVETVFESPEQKSWPLPTWATVLIILAAVVIIGGIGIWAFPQMGSGTSPTSPTEVSSPTEVASTGEVVENPSDVTSTPDSGSDWHPLTFMIPNPQIWDVTVDNQYTAIEQRDTDAYAWSTQSFQGDMMVSLELRSAVEALDLGWDEMNSQIPSQSSGCVIIYGDGTMHSYGSLVFCVHWDGYFLDKHYSRYDADQNRPEEYLAYILHDNPSEKVYSVRVEILDDMASMYVNGEQVLSSFFDTEEIDRSGRIGLFKYWSDGEITFSNIQIKTPSDGD